MTARVAELRGAPLRAILDYHSMPEPNSGCQLWLGYLSRRYGQVRWNGKYQFAHRLSWIDTKGPIPVGLHVLHKCDVPICVNPDHLFLGTHDDNMTDMARKGRARSGIFGQAHHAARLTEANVRAIRADDRPASELAALYGVTLHSIWAVRARRSWKHLP